jgi:hypothetical protein
LGKPFNKVSAVFHFYRLFYTYPIHSLSTAIHT